jgi:FkbM family methyltransferase
MRTVRDTRWGKMAFMANDRWIGESLLHYGEYAPDETRHLLMFVDKGSVVLDIGANVGGLTLPLARHAGHVWAFEPQPLTFELLQETVMLNALANVTCRRQALSDHSGHMNIRRMQWREDKRVNSGGTALEEDADGERTEIISVDSLKLAACTLIKIDVEGFELNVLNGAVETIRDHQPVLYVEADRDDQTPSLIAFMQAHGYTPYWDAPKLYAENNFAGNATNVFGKARSINLLCMPAGRALPDALQGLLPASEGQTFRHVMDHI